MRGLAHREQPDNWAVSSVLERARVMSVRRGPLASRQPGRGPEPKYPAGDHPSARHSGFAPRGAQERQARDGDRGGSTFDPSTGAGSEDPHGQACGRGGVAVRHVYEDPPNTSNAPGSSCVSCTTGASRFSPLADRLAKVVDRALAGHPDQLVRLLAPGHGRAGETRLMIALHRDLWARIIGAAGRPAAMLGF